MSTTTTSTEQPSLAMEAVAMTPAEPKKPAGYDPDDPTTKLNVIPTFASKIEEREWAKGQMVGIFRAFAKHGFADGFNGHVSLRDPVEPDTFWINPYAKHF